MLSLLHSVPVNSLASPLKGAGRFDGAAFIRRAVAPKTRGDERAEEEQKHRLRTRVQRKKNEPVSHIKGSGRRDGVERLRLTPTHPGRMVSFNRIVGKKTKKLAAERSGRCRRVSPVISLITVTHMQGGGGLTEVCVCDYSQ